MSADMPAVCDQVIPVMEGGISLNKEDAAADSKEGASALMTDEPKFPASEIPPRLRRNRLREISPVRSRWIGRLKPLSFHCQMTTGLLEGDPHESWVNGMPFCVVRYGFCAAGGLCLQRHLAVRSRLVPSARVNNG
jgi:hypothetical protein